MCQLCEDGAMSASGQVLAPLLAWLRHMSQGTRCPRLLGSLPSLGHKGRCREGCVEGAAQDTDSCPPPDSWEEGRAGQAPAPFPLAREGVRVLLFRDCDVRGRKLLYDSRTVVQVPLPDAPQASKPFFRSSQHAAPPSHASHSARAASAQPKTSVAAPCGKTESFVETSGGFGYQYRQQENDTKMLGELVFGSVALAYKGSCSKLHLLKNPHRILLSRTSHTPHSYMKPSAAGSDQGIEDSSFSSSLSSVNEALSRPDSLDVPWGPGGCGLAMEMPHMLTSSHSEGDSGFGGPPSPYSSTCGSFLSPHSHSATPYGTPSSYQGSGSSLTNNSGSLNSLQRRFLRNVNTSLDSLGREGDTQEEGGSPQSQCSRRTSKLGLAVIIQLGDGKTELQRHVENWLFLHLGVIEACINKLQASLDTAYLHRQTFVSSAHQAVAQLQQEVLDLVNGPRLPRPVWLGLLARPSPALHHTLCTHFVDTLASLLNTFDTKQTNFFISKLLTAVLTHHLGWVSTVAPEDGATSTPHQPPAPHKPCSLSSVERLGETYPYNAIWAQMCELNGAVGYPPRAARTLLVGSNTALLTQLLTVLSYIIRCSQVVEQDILPYQAGSCVGTEQQPCFSRTSSVASIVTIVENGRRDSQRDFNRDTASQHKKNSSVQLHRESSIRRSWRTGREGRGSRHFSSESRQAVMEAAPDLTHPTIRVSVDDSDPTEACQPGGKKVSDQAYKWMLNDGEEIVIKGSKSSNESTVSANTNTNSGLKRTGKECNVTTACDTPLIGLESGIKMLTSSKTCIDLASLADDMEGGGSSSQDVMNCVTVSPGQLYPALYELDDHRETFGPVVLETNVIKEKVKKLFRVSPYESSSSVAKTVPCTEKSTDISVGFQCDEAGVLHINTEHGECETALAFTNCRTTSAGEVRVPSKDIHPEVEEGGKVLYLSEEGDEAEVARTAVVLQEPKTSTNSYNKCLNPVNNVPNAIGFERINVLSVCGSDVENSGGKITCLPTPVDCRKTVRTLNVGRESAIDLTTLEKEKVIYPSLKDLKKDSGIMKGCTIKCSDNGTKTHRRHHSDPINGTVIAKAFIPYNLDTLKDVEEHLTDHKESSNTEKYGQLTEGDCGMRPMLSEPERSGGECVESPGQGEEEEACPCEPCASSVEECEAEAGHTPLTQCSLPVNMPRCVCNSTGGGGGGGRGGAGGGSVSLAESLLGGLLDHYSSVFVLQATTQTQHWHDALRYDLTTAAHRPTLDQHITEAVAVVADTDSWEVQVVSSHSYIVEQAGTSGVMGVRVEMSPLVSAITDSLLHLTRMGVNDQFVMQHLEERLCELYLKSQLLAQYLLEGVGGGAAGAAPHLQPCHLPELTRSLGLDLNDLPLLLAVASTHTPALTRMFGLSFK